MKPTADGLEHTLVMPYLTGVYLAVNAIQDVYLVVDGPNCVFFRTAQIQGNHDWHSTLASCTGLHRVADTDCTTERAAVGDQRLLAERLKQVDAIEGCRLILLTAMSPVALTGRQYDNVLAELGGSLKKPVVQVRSGSLTGDWLNGYFNTLEALAGQMEIDRPEDLRDEEVAIVGYLMDRNESDHRANLDEIKRLLEGLSLKMTSCWLSGDTVSDLTAAFRAGTVVSLPHGRKAAATLARRTGARLVECDLPIGLEATCSWLRQVGGATGRTDKAEALIDSELSATVPKLKWILPHALLNKGLVLLGSDPYLLKAVAGAFDELGCRVALAACFSYRAHQVEPGPADTFLLNPDESDLMKDIARLKVEGVFHLAIANSRTVPLLTNLSGKIPFVELGFPSYYTHALTDNPFVGFSGLLKLVERLTNQMAYTDIVLGGL